jgi:hypothetical protein
MKEKCFAYQNTKTCEWLKITRYREGYGYGYPVYEYEHKVFDSFDRSVMYSARNIIEEDFSSTKLKNKENWHLMEVEIKYNFTAAV